MKVLIIEDEINIRKLLRAYLEKEGFQVDEASNGQRGLTLQAENTYDLVILDIMLPEVDGWTVCQKIRKISHVPLIIITAKSADTDKILGLELGADDYLVKPFSPKELIARIKALFRRIKVHSTAPSPTEPPVTIGRLTIDPGQNLISYNGIDVQLTPKEFALVFCLAKNRHKVFTRSELLWEVWGDHFANTRTVDTHIKTIREKFRKMGIEYPVIETLWGVGYKLGGFKDED